MTRMKLGWALVGLWLMVAGTGVAQMTTTTVSDTVYNADGTPAQGTVLISWPQFTTVGGAPVAAGSTAVTLTTGGGLSVALAPNAGASPIGSYYTVVYHLEDGTSSHESWVVPVSTAAVNLAAVRATVMPVSVAMQAASRSYVDQAIARALGNGTVTGQYGQRFYAEGPSVLRGATLSGAQLAQGGIAGNFLNLLCTSAWAAGTTSCYNDGVDGSTTTMMLARYTTGNSSYGVTVPSAHSVSPAVTGSTVRNIYLIDMDAVFNDQYSSISTATSITNLTTLAEDAMADGYFVVVLTSVISDAYYTNVAAGIATVNQAARNKTIPSNLVMDAAAWMPNMLDSTVYNVGTPGNASHPNATGHALVESNLLACLISGGCETNFSGGYSSTPSTFVNGATVDQQLTVNSAEGGAGATGGGTIEVSNAFGTGAYMEMLGSTNGGVSSWDPYSYLIEANTAVTSNYGSLILDAYGVGEPVKIQSNRTTEGVFNGYGLMIPVLGTTGLGVCPNGTGGALTTGAACNIASLTLANAFTGNSTHSGSEAFRNTLTTFGNTTRADTNSTYPVEIFNTDLSYGLGAGYDTVSGLNGAFLQAFHTGVTWNAPLYIQPEGGTTYFPGAVSFGASGQATVDASGNITTSGRIAPQQSTPGSSSASCATGQVWTDAGYIYVCTAASTIKRVALSSF